MIEINEVNKEKFVVQYWGQNVLIAVPKYDSVRRYDVGQVGLLSLVNHGCYLELKPLSSITDEDAIELANIVLEPVYRKNWKVSRNFTVTGWPYFRVHHKNSPYYFQIDANLVNFDVGKMGESVTAETDMKPSQCIDYLRSKGYALPWMGLSVKDMVEAGWIKLIEV